MQIQDCVKLLLVLSILVPFNGCTRNYTVNDSLIEAKQTLVSSGFNSVEVTSVPGCYILQKPFFMIFTATGIDELPLNGVIGCDEHKGCEYKLFVTIEKENTEEEHEEEYEEVEYEVEYED